MKRKYLRTAITVVAILVTLGLGIAILYSDYFYNPTGSFSSLQVVSQAQLDMMNGTFYESSPTKGNNSAQLFSALDQWARQEDATILFKDGITAGCGFCGYSSWSSQELGLIPTNEESGVYVSDDPAFQAAYVQGDVLFPHGASMKILDVFSADRLPPVLVNYHILFPLTYGTNPEGIYFTDAKDLDAMTQVFQDHGYAVITSRSPATLGPWQLVQKLLSDSAMSRALLAALGGLVFFFCYCLLTRYRDVTQTLWVRHLFGLSKHRIFLGILLWAIGSVVLATGFLSLMLTQGMTYLSRRDLRQILWSCLGIFVGLSALVHGLGFWGIHQRFSRG